jgi:Ser/Thr protein kinase RdoA (MazF antagonist)
VLSRFQLPSEPVSCAVYGNGHINGTRLVTCQNGARYILQQINTGVFREPVLLMRNIELVTAHLKAKTPDPRGVLTLVSALNGETFVVENGEYWRVYEMVPGSICFDQADEALFFESAVAFGRFQNELSDFPAEALSETIRIFTIRPRACRL